MLVSGAGDLVRKDMGKTARCPIYVVLVFTAESCPLVS